MGRWFETIADLDAGADALRRGRYGVIEVVDGILAGVRLRPFPKLVSWPDLYLFDEYWRRWRRGDRCFLYYNQPRSCSQFLALKYLASHAGTSLASVNTALRTLDRIARLKQSDALVCDVANLRISDRMMRRYGWEAHAPAPWRRNYIKRFYGVFPV